ncbi:MAG: transcriptional repressor [Elusimicrobia bacterium]|nr:transcriptional repressor [Candidatus Liberimonas magnetica]
MEIINKKLQSKGIKPTYQRLKILKYFEGNHIHPTVDMIYRDLVKEIPTISRTTVYNTLDMLCRSGLMTYINITGTEVRYDALTDRHHHFLCEKCKKIFNMDFKCPICNKEEVDGHIVKELHGYLIGTCKECNKNG